MAGIKLVNEKLMHSLWSVIAFEIDEREDVRRNLLTVTFAMFFFLFVQVLEVTEAANALFSESLVRSLRSSPGQDRTVFFRSRPTSTWRSVAAVISRSGSMKI